MPRALLRAVRNDHSANDDEGAANQDTRARALMKYDPGNELRYDKEKDNVDSKQPAKVPRWRIHNIAIRKQNQRARREQNHSRDRSR